MTANFFTARSARLSDDDDEFIVPDDSEDDAASRSSRVSKRSSRISLLSDEEDEENARTQKPKKSTARPTLKKAHAVSGSASASANNFLTAAEQRAQVTKEEKKSQDDPFSFLLDIKDVCIHVDFPPKSRSDAHLFRRKTVSDLRNLVMTPGHCISLRRLGKASALSRNRC